MNAIMNTPTGGGMPATMSSLEIAELCEKEHKNVIRDIRAMLEVLAEDGSDLSHVHEEKDTRGYTKEFLLPKDLTLTLVAGYNIQLRHRIVKRLEELEVQARDPMRALNDPAMMRGLLLTYSEKLIELQPKADALDRIATADGSLCVTDAAKALQVRPKDLFGKLQTEHWIYRRTGGKGYLGYQAKVQSGLVEHKVDTIIKPDGSEIIREQVRITPKGLAKLAGSFGATA